MRRNIIARGGAPGKMTKNESRPRVEDEQRDNFFSDEMGMTLKNELIKKT
jgi:hypothetical protein